MYSSLRRRFVILGSAVLCALASCTTHSTVTSVSLADSIELPPTEAHSTGTIARAASLLTGEQQKQLKQLGIKVILPTYLPAGFKVTQVEAHKKQNSQDPTDYSYYTVTYLGPKNTCIEAGDGYQTLWIANPSKRQLDTKLGKVEIVFGKYRRSETIQHWASIGKGSNVIFTGGKVAGGRDICLPVSQAEFNQVLKSAAVLP